MAGSQNNSTKKGIKGKAGQRIMWKLVILGLALFVLIKLMKGEKKQHRESVNKKNQDGQVPSADMVKDPVCGTYVRRDGPDGSGAGIRVRNGDAVEYFCSYTCRDAYLASIQATQEKEKEK